MKDHVECWMSKKHRLWISRASHGRAIQEVLFGNWAIYKAMKKGGRFYGDWRHAGLTSRAGAFQWLAGTPRNEIEGWVVEDCTASDEDLQEPPLKIPPR